MEYRNMGRKYVKTLEEFDQLVNNNKVSGRHWYHGLKNEQLREMSKIDARAYVAKLEKEKELIDRTHVAKLEEERESIDRIVLISTWNISCGIATYTKYLFDSLNIIAPDSFVINPINDGVLKYKNMGRLTHLQHEFGIVPKPPKMMGKSIITWHTVSRRTNAAMKEYESNYDVVAHIVHSEYALSSIDSSKDVWAIPHGSMLIPEMSKEDARKLLGIDIDMPIGFVFGFQSKDKNYGRLADAAKNTGIHLMISGARHNVATSINVPNDKNVTFINRYLTENEVNLYALASDMLLFDYVARDHYSVSGAMHRIVGAGRPVICSDIKHFNDIENGKDCLKFTRQSRLEWCIRRALKDSERFGLAAREYAEKTSWEKIARMHIEVYRKYAYV
jgi:glycosyltransferase involved in cell wall biosynthesis